MLCPQKLSKLNATRYQSEKLEINTVGYNRSYIYRIEAGKKIVFSSAIKYVLPATNSSINPLSGNFDRSIQVKTSEVFNSLDYNTNSIIKYKLYEKDFDGTIQPVSGGEDTKPYTTNISVNSKDFSLTEKKVYFAKIYYADSTDGLEHFLYDTQDFAVRDFVIITDVKDISKKYDLLKYDMKFNIFSSESKTMNIVLKDMEQVTEEIPYQATAGMKKTSYIAEYIFQGTGSNIVRDNMKISFKDYSEEYDYQVQYVRFSANASGTEPVSLNLSYGYSDATYINRLYCVVETETGTNTIELASGESIVLQDNYNLENTGAQAGKMIYIYVDYKDGRTGVLEAKTVISV